MKRIEIDLPDPIDQFVKIQVEHGGYQDISEYVLSLIRLDRQRLRELLLQGLDSGDAGPMTASDWRAVRDKLAARHATS